ncbi:MAG: 3-hydroxyacyl-CoA dehydrogenase family protein [Dehalococcoidia bacterium]|nr:MAG: 3-hydroxyacyl-CoA dehydrogenase family protein [Dehalococcoidia bacterium]
MELNNIKRIGIVGAGAMGAQLAQLFAQVGGYQVTISDINDDLVSNGIRGIDGRLQKYFVDKGKLTADQKSKIMGSIKGTTSIAELAKDSDFVIEAAIENMNIKKKIFQELDANAPAETILASNTSALPITLMTMATKRPDKVIGTHFMNPVAVMKLVEVITPPMVSDDTTRVTVELMKKVGKEPVMCKDISLGFLANRAYAAMLNEAVQMVWERVASPQDIDKALKLGYNFPMGPCELFDFTGGWGISASSEEDRIKEVGDAKGRCHPLVKLMTRAGYCGGLGKKGIYAFWDDVLSKW